MQMGRGVGEEQGKEESTERRKHEQSHGDLKVQKMDNVGNSKWSGEDLPLRGKWMRVCVGGGGR